jgi:hypothetical protein
MKKNGSGNPTPATSGRNGARGTLKLLYAALAAALGVTPGIALAGNFSIGAYDTGSYRQDGTHNPGNTGYDVDAGVFDYTDHNAFFAFNTSSLKGRVVTASSFQVNSYGIHNSYSNPTVDFYHVSSSAATVTSGGGVAVFNDLGSGTTYGSRYMPASNTNYATNLNAAANSAIQSSAASGSFLIGASLDDGGSASYGAFQGSQLDSNTRLQVSTLDPAWSATGPSFGNVLVGTSKSASYMISNTGATGTTLMGTLSNVTGQIAAAAQNLAIDVGRTWGFNGTFDPTARGTVTSTQTAIVNTGASGDEVKSITMTGKGVAAVKQDVADVPVTPTAVRVGTTALVGSVTVNNVGDGNLSGAGVVSNLRGEMVASGVAGATGFSGGGAISLTDGGSLTRGLIYSATARGQQTGQLQLNYLNGSEDGRNLASSTAYDFDVVAVGPVFGADKTGLDFGNVEAGATGHGSIAIINSSTDYGYGDSLTGLTLLGANFTGAHASLFSLDSFMAGTVLSTMEWMNLDFSFSPTMGLAAGTYFADLTLRTDEGSYFGGAGKSYTFHLSGTVPAHTAPIPEPETYAMLLAGLGLVGFVARRRRQNRA